MTERRRRAVVASSIPVTLSTFRRELLRQLGAAGFETLVVSSPGTELDAMAADLSVPVTALPMTRELSPRADALALRRWVRLLRRERPFLVMTATPKASLVGLVAARLTGVPRRVYYLGGLRLEGETGVRRSVLAPAERLTASCAHVVVVNSPSLAVAVSRLGWRRRERSRSSSRPARTASTRRTSFRANPIQRCDTVSAWLTACRSWASSAA